MTLHRFGAPRWPGLLRLALLALVLGGCASPSGPAVNANRPDGEGYAGTGELLLRVGMPQASLGWLGSLSPQRTERASVEVRYLGLDGAGRALFERSDHDALASAAADAGHRPAAGPDAGIAPDGPPNVQLIAVDLRLGRQIRVQGKIIEILQASASGVVFRLY